MSLRYALLGLLAEEPASGYELTRRFQQVLQRYAWHAQNSQIYPELNQLSRDGLAAVVEEGPRGRRTYAITDAGREELRRWMRNPPDVFVVRNEFVLRLFLLSALEPGRGAGRAAQAGRRERRGAGRPARAGGQVRRGRRSGRAAAAQPDGGRVRPAVLPDDARMGTVGA